MAINKDMFIFRAKKVLKCGIMMYYTMSWEISRVKPTFVHFMV